MGVVKVDGGVRTDVISETGYKTGMLINVRGVMTKRSSGQQQQSEWDAFATKKTLLLIKNVPEILFLIFIFL